MKGTTMVYLALAFLVLMMLYSKKEGFDSHEWLSLSNYFTYSEKPATNTTATTSGTGLSGKEYETTTDTINDLTSSEKSTTKSALNKLIAQNESNEVLISCINKVKTKL
jgi:hypothetical protein